MIQKILIVEDEKRLADLHRDYLQQAGFDTTWIEDGAEVVSEVQRETFDLILLDLMLPHKDGMDICKEIRAFSGVPIIMVTARFIDDIWSNCYNLSVLFNLNFAYAK